MLSGKVVSECLKQTDPNIKVILKASSSYVAIEPPSANSKVALACMAAERLVNRLLGDKTNLDDLAAVFAEAHKREVAHYAARMKDLMEE